MRRYPYPFYGQYADMKATIANEVAGCETSDDLARLKRWVSSFCQDIQMLADEAQLPAPVEEDEVAHGLQ